MVLVARLFVNGIEWASSVWDGIDYGLLLSPLFVLGLKAGKPLEKTYA